MGKIHESVLIGYFCQAVGWIARDLDQKREATAKSEQRLLRAINLSHNPLDPAIGDMILQLDNEESLPKDFYVFEFKVSWNKGVLEEHEKFRSKNNGNFITPTFVEYLTQRFPEAEHAHLFGALAQTATKRSGLSAHPYWNAMLNKPTRYQSILSKLAQIAYGQAGPGFSLDRLITYMAALNEHAGQDSMAASGSIRFAVAYQDYQLHSFNLDSILEYQLEKRRQQDLQQLDEHEERDERDDDYSQAL